MSEHHAQDGWVSRQRAAVQHVDCRKGEKRKMANGFHFSETDY